MAALILGKMYPYLRQPSWKAWTPELSVSAEPEAPSAQGQIARAQLLAFLSSSWYAGGGYHQAASQTHPPALVPSPSSASGCCPLIVYIPFYLCL